MGEIEKRYAAEKNRKEDWKNMRLRTIREFIDTNSEIQNFKQFQLPIFVELLKAYANEVNLVFVETENYCSLASFELIDRNKVYFEGTRTPRLGYGRLYKFCYLADVFYDRPEELKAVTFEYGMERLTKKIERVPKEIVAAQEWYNDFLFESHKLAIERRNS